MAKTSGDAELQGRYANCFEVGYNDVEFIVDFGQQYGSGEPLYHTRIVTSPLYIEGFLAFLTKSYAAFRDSRREGERGDG